MFIQSKELSTIFYENLQQFKKLGYYASIFHATKNFDENQLLQLLKTELENFNPQFDVEKLIELSELEDIKEYYSL